MPAPESDPIAASTFDVTVVARDDLDLLRLTGDLDLAAETPFEVMIDLLQPFTRPVLVDLGGVTFIDVAGLALLLRLHAAVARAAQSMQVARPSRSALLLFELAGALHQFGLRASDAGVSPVTHRSIPERHSRAAHASLVAPRNPTVGSQT